jgi:phosphoglycolate phosphatase
MLKRLVLFDLDGVLLDSKRNMEIAWARVREVAGVDVPFEAYFSEIGRPFPDILARLGVAADAGRIERIYAAESFASMASAEFFPGVPEVLRSLLREGRQIGVVTSKDETRTSAVLHRLGIPFGTVQCPRPGVPGKPAPDPLLAALAALGGEPADAVYVGDMDPDYEAAAAAGIDYLHAAWGYGPPPAGAVCVPSIDRLHGFLS